MAIKKILESPDKQVNKVIYGGETLIDLTGDTVSVETLLEGATAHDKSGATIVGTCTYDVDSGDATATVAEILKDKTAYARGALLKGTMPNNGKVTGIINTATGSYKIALGYHDGSGTVSIDPTEQGKLIPENIRTGITVLGVEGTMTGTEDVKAQAKEVTPSISQQTVTPDGPEYNYLSQVTVAKIPYAETENAAGGVTVSIAAPADDASS